MKMPITAFSSFTDGLDPKRRNRDHFVINTDLDDDGPWIPYADGVWLQPCCFDVTSGGFSVLLKLFEFVPVHKTLNCRRNLLIHY